MQVYALPKRVPIKMLLTQAHETPSECEKRLQMHDLQFGIFKRKQFIGTRKNSSNIQMRVRQTQDDKEEEEEGKAAATATATDI